MIADTEKRSRRIDSAVPIPENDTGVVRWLALPTYVREAYDRKGLVIQLTTGCSCACWYCPVVDDLEKGRVTSMIPLQSAKEVISRSNPNLHGRDIYYYKSEPFDYPYYLALMTAAIDRGRRVYTSTSVPKQAISTIMAVLEAIAQLDDYDRHRYPFRFSVNGPNQKRARQLIQYAENLGITVESGDRMNRSTMARYPVLGSGEVSERGLIGIIRSGCDGLIISPDSLRTSISMPVCQAAPTGILSIPPELEGKVYPQAYLSSAKRTGWQFTDPFGYMTGSEQLTSLPTIGLDGIDAVLRFITGARRLQDLLLGYSFTNQFSNTSSKLLEQLRISLHDPTAFNRGNFIEFSQEILALPEELLCDSVLEAFLKPLINVIHELARKYTITIPQSTE